MKAVEQESHEKFVCELRPTPCRCGLECVMNLGAAGVERSSIGLSVCDVFPDFRWQGSKSTRKMIVWTAS
jgi:hypothetical protein